MKNNYDLLDWALLFLAAVTSLVVRFLKDKMPSQRIVALNIVVGVSIAFFVVPAAADYFDWSVRVSCGVTFLSTMFWDRLSIAAEDKINRWGKADTNIVVEDVELTFENNEDINDDSGTN